MDRHSYTIRLLGDFDMHLVTSRKSEVVPWVLGLAAQLSFEHACVVRVYENGKVFREVITRTTI